MIKIAESAAKDAEGKVTYGSRTMLADGYSAHQHTSVNISYFRRSGYLQVTFKILFLF